MKIVKRKEEEQTGKGFSYNGVMAHWWLRRSRDYSHRHAYRKIADFIHASYQHNPKAIVDYACGAGDLLFLLSHRFPHSRLIGLDGSSYLLGLALRRLSRMPQSDSARISLFETALPRFNFLRGRADLVIFCFPNMTPSPNQENKWEKLIHLNRNDREIARCLAPQALSTLEWSRSIAQNLRRLLVPGGICVRVEYGTANRHELSPAELELVSFEEGSLDAKVGGRMPRQWFRVQASAYFRSRVLEDVYQQTRDKRDRNGGYLITVLRAV